MLRSLFIILSLLEVCAPVNAQTLNLYTRILDPRGIARLDGLDTSRTKSICFHGNPAWWKIDSTDHYGIVAEDTGSGIITHIWSTAGMPDSICTMKLFIDDTLILVDYYNEFFQTLRGIFRPPLDTLTNAANVWDVQIPYHHGFKISAASTNDNLYYGIMWHAVPEHPLPWFKLHASTTEQATQTAAEHRIYERGSPWNDFTAVHLNRSDTLLPLQHKWIAEISGPAMLQVLRFQPESYDFAALDSTWLNIYWDYCPIPSVHVPLKDFFLSPVNVTKVYALQMQVDRDSGLICYFPMPFYRHATIEIMREGSTPLAIHSSVQYNSEYIDRNAYGYFHADFHESNPTKYHVYHPVIHTLGRGRYIGMGFGVMDHPYAVFLEGDPIFNIDSDETYRVHYTGGEDYFNGAWWFPNGPFTLPFAGYTDYIDQFYRFQYLDCTEFTRSFDFDLEPGARADIYDHYRTVGFYYQHWTPFWTDRDTLIAGESWSIAGTGYGRKQDISISLGPIELHTSANDTGSFNYTLLVPSDWKSGIYNLSVSGETSPNKYYILTGPAIRTLVDTLPITLRTDDSLYVRGTGFRRGEHIAFYLDSIPLGQSVYADSENGFVTMLRIPYLAEHAYSLIARGDQSGNAVAKDQIRFTHTIDLEFEDMMPPTYKTAGQCYAEDVSYLWEAAWNKQMFVYFKPDTIFYNAALEFAFKVPHPDTFAITFHNSIGHDLGLYNVAIDGNPVGQIDGYFSDPTWDPLPSGPLSMGVHYLDSGIHKIRFTCIGKADSARNYWIEPDNLILVPITRVPPDTGTLTLPSSETLALSRVQVYPNPLYKSFATIDVELATDSPFFLGEFSIQLYDIMGRLCGKALYGRMLNGKFHCTMPTSNMVSGTYFIRAVISSDSGQALDLSVTPLKIE